MTATPVRSISPTSTLNPFAAATRIQFAPDTTRVNLEFRDLAANGFHDYVIGAAKGQQMTISAAPATFEDRNFAVGIEVYGADGRALGSDAPASGTGPVSWSGALPSTQDYYIRVTNRTGATRYSLQVSIPQRIIFAPGATGITLDGGIVGSIVNEYVVQARQGQTMQVTAVSPGNHVCLTVVGHDGTPLARSHMRLTSWAGVLYATQDYTISAGLCEGDAVSNVRYTLEVQIAELATPVADSPASGVCELAQGQEATIEIRPDMPSPRCVQVTQAQHLKVVNRTNVMVQIRLAQFMAQLQPGGEYSITAPFGSYLMPGVHVVLTSAYGGASGPELWLLDK